MPHQDAVQPGPSGIDYETTLVLAIELSSRSWVLAAQVPVAGQIAARDRAEQGGAGRRLGGLPCPCSGCGDDDRASDRDLRGRLVWLLVGALAGRPT